LKKVNDIVALRKKTHLEKKAREERAKRE